MSPNLDKMEYLYSWTFMQIKILNATSSFREENCNKFNSKKEFRAELRKHLNLKFKKEMKSF